MTTNNPTSNTDTAMPYDSVLGVDFSSGDFINTPKLILTGRWSMKCPVCGREWFIKGRGYGFVKEGASRHVYFCFVKYLERKGLKMKDKYNMDELAWELEKITT